ncbi:hypothetical protein VM1G_11978 [Cytospora mali]|uniref:Uncharacterized protein n=1 Tax=Cytospora mali TaxID=578113 RepID=A0A194WEB2_CYTMA|nr:hypothetical protein VM1G_11978 [Valsa mali]
MPGFKKFPVTKVHVQYLEIHTETESRFKSAHAAEVGAPAAKHLGCTRGPVAPSMPSPREPE